MKSYGSWFLLVNISIPYTGHFSKKHCDNQPRLSVWSLGDFAYNKSIENQCLTFSTNSNSKIHSRASQQPLLLFCNICLSVQCYNQSISFHQLFCLVCWAFSLGRSVLVGASGQKHSDSVGIDQAWQGSVSWCGNKIAHHFAVDWGLYWVQLGMQQGWNSAVRGSTGGTKLGGKHGFIGLWCIHCGLGGVRISMLCRSEHWVWKLPCRIWFCTVIDVVTSQGSAITFSTVASMFNHGYVK